MELLRITRQIHCKAVEQRATLIYRQYNRDWGLRTLDPPIDPYLTSPCYKILAVPLDLHKRRCVKIASHIVSYRTFVCVACEVGSATKRRVLGVMYGRRCTDIGLDWPQTPYRAVSMRDINISLTSLLTFRTLYLQQSFSAPVWLFLNVIYSQVDFQQLSTLLL